MCFRRFVFPLCRATSIADWLSMCSWVVGSGLGSMCGAWAVASSVSRRRAHRICCSAELAATYSASQVLSATVSCFLALQDVGLPYVSRMYPVVDFLSSLSA